MVSHTFNDYGHRPTSATFRNRHLYDKRTCRAASVAGGGAGGVEPSSDEFAGGTSGAAIPSESSEHFGSAEHAGAHRTPPLTLVLSTKNCCNFTEHRPPAVGIEMRDVSWASVFGTVAVLHHLECASRQYKQSPHCSASRRCVEWSRSLPGIITGWCMNRNLQRLDQIASRSDEPVSLHRAHKGIAEA